mgnify:CR=1 FL=1
MSKAKRFGKTSTGTTGRRLNILSARRTIVNYTRIYSALMSLKEENSLSREQFAKSLVFFGQLLDGQAAMNYVRGHPSYGSRPPRRPKTGG